VDERQSDSKGQATVDFQSNLFSCSVNVCTSNFRFRNRCYLFLLRRLFGLRPPRTACVAKMLVKKARDVQVAQYIKWSFGDTENLVKDSRLGRYVAVSTNAIGNMSVMSSEHTDCEECNRVDNTIG